MDKIFFVFSRLVWLSVFWTEAILHLGVCQVELLLVRLESNPAEQARRLRILAHRAMGVLAPTKLRHRQRQLVTQAEEAAQAAFIASLEATRID